MYIRKGCTVRHVTTKQTGVVLEVDGGYAWVLIDGTDCKCYVHQGELTATS